MTFLIFTCFAGFRVGVGKADKIGFVAEIMLTFDLTKKFTIL